jgi:hypothetical protein
MVDEPSRKTPGKMTNGNMNTPNTQIIVPPQPTQPTQPTPLEQLGLPIEEVKDLLALHGAGGFGRQVGTQLKREIADATVRGVNTLMRLVLIAFIIGGFLIFAICLLSVPHTKPHTDTNRVVQHDVPAVNPELPVTLYFDSQTGLYRPRRVSSDDLQQQFSKDQARDILQKQGH